MATTVQTLIFDSGVFDKKAAEAWLSSHGFKKMKAPDESEQSIRYRQIDPGKFQDGSFRTIKLKKGIKAVIGVLKAQTGEREKLVQAQIARSKRYGIEVLSGGSLTPPSGYPTDEADYADPVNYMYPLIPDARAKNARARFKQNAGQYSKEASKKVIHERIVKKLIQIGAEPSYNKADPLDKLLSTQTVSQIGS